MSRELFDLTAWQLATFSSEKAEEHELDENEFTNGLIAEWYLDEIPNAPNFGVSQKSHRQIKTKRTTFLDCETLSVKENFIKREEGNFHQKGFTGMVFPDWMGFTY